jgi:plasmid stabilization system protein ParE
VTYKVHIQPSAEADFEDAFGWISLQAPRNAVRWITDLYSAIASLENFPQRCRLAPESPCRDREIRHLVFGNYRILFTVYANSVVVLHLRHAAQQPLPPDEMTLP